jgi:hypothetical protein
MLIVLSGLRVVDLIVESDLGYRNHVYLRGDAQVDLLLGGPESEENRHVRPAALELQFTDSNVVKEFGYPARGIAQLRLTGWVGRYLIR